MSSRFYCIYFDAICPVFVVLGGHVPKCLFGKHYLPNLCIWNVFPSLFESFLEISMQTTYSMINYFVYTFTDFDWIIHHWWYLHIHLLYSHLKSSARVTALFEKIFPALYNEQCPNPKIVIYLTYHIKKCSHGGSR